RGGSKGDSYEVEQTLALHHLGRDVANAYRVAVLRHVAGGEVDDARRFVAAEVPAAEHTAETLARRCVHLLAVNLGHHVFTETVQVATERRLREPTVRGLQLAELLHESFPFVVVETETLHYELAHEPGGEVRADPAESLLT